MNLAETRSALLAAIAAVTLAPACVAQCAPPQWSAANAYPGVDGKIVCSTLWDPDGPGPAGPALTIGGNFNVAGFDSADNVAYWDGAKWHGLGTTQLLGDVPALAVLNGDLYAANITFTGSGVGRWNGSSWQQVGTGGGGSALALAVYNGELYAGRGPPYPAITRWDGVTWQPLPVPGFALVGALAVHNGLLVVAGAPTGLESQVATWNGNAWTSLGTGMNASVSVLAVHDGSLVAAGAFTMADGLPANRVARWTGSAWEALGGGLPATGFSLVSWNGSLVASSGTSLAASSTVMRWDGVAWQTLATTPAGRVLRLAEFGGGLFALGEFTALGGIVAHHVARWDGASWSRVGAGIDFEILALANHGGRLIAGGSFSVAGAVEARGIASSDGATWQALGSGLGGSVGIPHAVGALATHNGDLVAAGSFVTAGGAPASNIARWDGASWHALGAGLNGNFFQYPDMPNRVVRALAVFNGELIAGGYIADSNGAPLSYIARWNGSSWQPLGTGLNGPVLALGVYNGELYAGGPFSGAAWQPVGTGTTGTVRALAVYGGDLVAAGNFGSAGGLSAPGVARWNGVAWNPLPLVGNNSVTALGVYGSDLIAASTLWALPSGLTPGIARWTGSSWETLGAGVQSSSTAAVPGIRSFAVHGGSLFAAGSIVSAGGIASSSLARWAPPLPLLAISQPASGSVTVLDAWLVPGHEYFNVVSTDLCPGGPGAGPYGGLCANDPSALWQQITLPLGTPPFHFAAAGATATFGPYALPPGFAFEAVAFDLVGTAPCISTAIRHTVW
jgi:trimeric autotransporter adhesin